MDVIEELGGLSEVARTLKCKPPSVSEWRKKGIPIRRCTELERARDGRVPCERMRPDVAWVRIPDPDWPWHPSGRPAVDVTRMETRFEFKGGRHDA